jgi:hypothetical protein
MCYKSKLLKEKKIENMSNTNQSNKNYTQLQFLVELLRGNNIGITVNEAKNRYKIGNLRARMTELRQRGVRVRTKNVGNNVREYYISQRLVNGSKAKATV